LELAKAAPTQIVTECVILIVGVKMMTNIILKDVLGGLLIITSIFDAFKYSLQARKIQKEKTARSMSRKFINFALMNDFVKLTYGIIIGDLFIMGSSVLALICMLDLWWQIYWFYPYRMRGCSNFKRPNILFYIINSIVPNSIRKRL
jgi:hypothetical protein